MSNWEKREWNREQSKQILRKEGVQFTEHNKGAHLKIGSVDFWPGTGLWKDQEAGITQRGVKELIKYLKPVASGPAKVLTVDQIFNIAKGVSPCNLQQVCKAIHREIYGVSKPVLEPSNV